MSFYLSASDLINGKEKLNENKIRQILTEWYVDHWQHSDDNLHCGKEYLRR